MVTGGTFQTMTVAQLRTEVTERVRYRVAFTHPKPVREKELRYPYIEASPRRSRDGRLTVPVPGELVRHWQEQLREFVLLERLTELVRMKELWPPIVAPDLDSHSYDHACGDWVHSDNRGWELDGLKDDSFVQVFDPTAEVDSGKRIVNAKVQWIDYGTEWRTRLLVVQSPVGLKKRAAELVSTELGHVRAELVRDWLGGPDQARQLLGLA